MTDDQPLAKSLIERFTQTSQDIEFWKLMVREYTFPVLFGMLLLGAAACVLAYYQLGRKAQWWPLAGMFFFMAVIMGISSLITGIDPLWPKERLEHFAVFSWPFILVCLFWFLAVMGWRLWTEGGK